MTGSTLRQAFGPPGTALSLDQYRAGLSSSRPDQRTPVGRASSCNALRGTALVGVDPLLAVDVVVPRLATAGAVESPQLEASKGGTRGDQRSNDGCCPGTPLLTHSSNKSCRL